MKLLDFIREYTMYTTFIELSKNENGIYVPLTRYIKDNQMFGFALTSEEYLESSLLRDAEIDKFLPVNKSRVNLNIAIKDNLDIETDDIVKELTRINDRIDDLTYFVQDNIYAQ